MFKNVSEYCNENCLSKAELKEQISEAIKDLALSCSRNFDGDAATTERVCLTLSYFHDILSGVE